MGVVQEQAQCVVCSGVLEREGYEGHAGKPEALGLREGVKAPLVSQSMKQVLVYNKQSRELCNYLTGQPALWHWSKAFYKFRFPKDPPPDC